MCKPSDKLQLCTCALTRKLPDNYWVLHRYVGSKNEMVVGEVMAPYFSQEYLSVYAQLLNHLNDRMCFDKLPDLQVHDILIIYLRNKKSHDQYAFRYTGKDWEEFELAPFELENFYEEMNEGIVKAE